MAQWLGERAVLAEEPDSIPGTHTVANHYNSISRRCCPPVSAGHLYTHVHRHTQTLNTHTHKKINKSSEKENEYHS